MFVWLVILLIQNPPAPDVGKHRRERRPRRLYRPTEEYPDGPREKERPYRLDTYR